MHRYGAGLVGSVALCAPPAAYYVCTHSQFAFWLQMVLIVLYMMHAAVLMAQQRAGSPVTETPRNDAAIEAALEYLEYRTCRHRQSAYFLLAGGITLNILVVIWWPPDATTLLWMVTFSFVIYALASLRLELLRIQIEAGDFWTSPEVRAISLVLLKQRGESGRPPGKRQIFSVQISTRTLRRGVIGEAW
jgi:hypothetical protein